MEPEGLLPHTQEPATCPYTEPDQSGPCSHPTFLRSILILSSHLRVGLPSGLLPSVSHQNKHTRRIKPRYTAHTVSQQCIYLRYSSLSCSMSFLPFLFCPLFILSYSLSFSITDYPYFIDCRPNPFPLLTTMFCLLNSRNRKKN